jgi:hypothetical protein
MMEESTTMEDKDIIERVKSKHYTLLSYIATAINLGYNMMLVYLTGENALKRPNWLNCTTKDYDAELLKDKILDEFENNPGMYGYGILLGKQSGDFYLVCIDIDIDNEYKDIALEDLKKVFDKYRIDYAVEKTKSGRYHVYVALDGLTENLKKTRKLKYKHLKDSIKYKNGEAVQGEIELLGTSGKHMSTVYTGAIDDEVPFCTDYMPKNAANVFDNALLEFQGLNHLTVHQSSQQTVHQTDQQTTNPFDIEKFTKFFRLARQYDLINGWEIDKLVSAVCVKNNMTDDEIHDVFQEIYDDEYDWKTTEYLIEHTREKDPEYTPSIGSVIYHAKNFVKDNRLSDEEKSFIRDFITTLIKRCVGGHNKVPEYLLDAEQAYFLSSVKKSNKTLGAYYVERWFVERNINHVIQVWFYEIETLYPKNIYCPHRVLNHAEPIGIKVEVKKLISDTNNEVYEYIINDEFTFAPSTNFDRLEDLAIEIAKKCSRYLPRFDITLFQKYCGIKINEYLAKHDGKPQPCVVSKITGWGKDYKTFYHYDLNDEYHELSRDNPLYKHEKAESFNQEEQHKLVYNLLKEGKLLGVLLTISAASILLKPFRLQNITCVLGGNPSAGKTTASLIATSLFYKSDDLLINANTTKVGVELLLTALNSMPLLIDEGALQNYGADIKHLIFSIASGKGRTRGRKDLTVDTKDIKSNVFYTSETTDIDDVKRAGAFRRMLYLVIEKWEDFTTLFNIKTYRPNRHYAGCGVDYIRFAIENLDTIEERFAIETEHFGVKYPDITGMAETLYAGIILLEQFYSERTGKSIIFTTLRQTIDDILEKAKETFVAAKVDIVFAFEQHLFNNLNRFGQVDFDKYRAEEGVPKLVLVYQPSGKEILGEYDRTTQTFLITKRGMEIIAKELERERTLLHKALYEAGVISKDMESKYLKLLGRSARVYVVKFNAENHKEENQMSIELEPGIKKLQESMKDLDVPL